ncbi:PREDICTED: uncharacterized protein LOC108525026 [Rhinopithecus bieti]|uniref:uncharacterized protein LOC108525026 n=1 Tax=Rhinopithecus bieti TaxID=61621 RepID=UPI00083C1BAD|nr:PREDICTED: uncharacterized protein LOC108525026 [Rhinopithecus bieti]
MAPTVCTTHSAPQITLEPTVCTTVRFPDNAGDYCVHDPALHGLPVGRAQRPRGSPRRAGSGGGAVREEPGERCPQARALARRLPGAPAPSRRDGTRAANFPSSLARTATGPRARARGEAAACSLTRPPASAQPPPAQESRPQRAEGPAATRPRGRSGRGRSRRMRGRRRGAFADGGERGGHRAGPRALELGQAWTPGQPRASVARAPRACPRARVRASPRTPAWLGGRPYPRRPSAAKGLGAQTRNHHLGLGRRHGQKSITDSTELPLSGEVGYTEGSHLEREDSPLQAASILNTASLLPASLHLEPKLMHGHADQSSRRDKGFSAESHVNSMRPCVSFCGEDSGPLQLCSLAHLPHSSSQLSLTHFFIITNCRVPSRCQPGSTCRG